MDQPIVFFADPRNNSRIQSVGRSLQESNTNHDVVAGLGMTLEIIASNAEEFDKCCPYNIAKIGAPFISLVSEFKNDLSKLDTTRLKVLVFRFLSEFDLSKPGELSMELESFMRTVVLESPNYLQDWQDQIDYARHRMPISILKMVLNSSDFTLLRSAQSMSQRTSDNIAAWGVEMTASEERVQVLQKTLTEQKNAFNFVGLSKGFSNLEDTVTKELDRLQGSLFVLGCLLLLPVVLEILSINLGWIDTKNNEPITLIISAIASLTATLLFLYFFRITLRSADSCRAQLVQIRLRMTLCQFIQNYADYSMEIKGKNSEALSKFETLIFSGIVSSDEKLPSTFDGIEQLGGLFKAVRGEGK